MAYNARMILGVMSDSHGNRGLLHRAAREMRETYQVDLFIHLGDDYSDAAELEMSGYPVRAVPGLWCPEYGNGRTPKRLSFEVLGLQIAGAHAEKDLRPMDRSAAIVLLGHTHKASVDRLGKSVYINPGHLKGATSRGEPPSFAIIRLNEATVEVTLVHVQTLTAFQQMIVGRDELA